MNYHHLRYFRLVAREGSLTRAARRLNVSQSAVSTQIRQLEERLGHDLLNRSGRRLTLTEAGRIALDHADVIFETGDELLAALRRGGGDAPQIRIGALATLSRNFLLSLLRPLLLNDVAVSLQSGTAAELVARLDALALDLIVLNQPPGAASEAGLFAHRLAEQDVSLVGTPDLVGEAIGLRDLLATRPLVAPGPSSSIRVGLDALAARLAIQPRIVVEADDMAMLRLLAREGVGIAAIPPIVVRDELASGRLVEGHGLPGIGETFYAITRERQFPNPSIALVLDGALDGELARTIPSGPAAA